MGNGVVVDIKGNGKDMQVTVAFSGNGVRTLMLQYADLQKTN